MRTTKAELLELTQEIESELEKLKLANELYQRKKNKRKKLNNGTNKPIQSLMI